MAEFSPTNVAATVTIGDGKEISVDRSELLWLVDTEKRMRPNMLLGRATKSRVDALIFCLQQIRSVCAE